MKKLKWSLFCSLAVGLLVFGAAANANVITGTFSGTVTSGNTGNPIGSPVTGNFSYGPNVADYSFVTYINSVLFDSATGFALFSVDANGLPNSGGHPGATYLYINPSGFLQFALLDRSTVLAQVTYTLTPATATPDAASTCVLLLLALAGLEATRRMVLVA